jgi:hypothetical protein
LANHEMHCCCLLSEMLPPQPSDLFHWDWYFRREDAPPSAPESWQPLGNFCLLNSRFLLHR